MSCSDRVRSCVLESYEKVEKFDNYIKCIKKLRDFEIGPSDDFVCQYMQLKNSMSRMQLELSRKTSTRKLYTDELQ